MSSPDSTPDARSIDSPVAPCPLKNKHWIELELVDEDNNPVADEPYLLVASDQQEYRGKTDARGVARISAIVAGDCRISFPNLDGEAWDAL
jgi:hypothetical protein